VQYIEFSEVISILNVGLLSTGDRGGQKGIVVVFIQLQTIHNNAFPHIALAVRAILDVE
jgi:hypothetical protein